MKNTQPRVLSSIVGFSRMGRNRETKTLIESYWKDVSIVGGEESNLRTKQLVKDAAIIHDQIVKDLSATGLDLIPNDFSFYDQVLDAAFMVGAVPERYRQLEEEPTLRTYFAMARGLQEKGEGKVVDVPALPMKKWFDTNYHYIVPEFERNQEFYLLNQKPVDDYVRVRDTLDIKTKPSIVGPLTLLKLGLPAGQENFDLLTLLPKLLPVYKQLVELLSKENVEWIQFDEPILAVYKLDQTWTQAFLNTYQELQSVAKNSKIVLSTYFGSVEKNLNVVKDFPVSGLQIDLVRSESQLKSVLDVLPDSTKLFLGLIEGRNIWKGNLAAAIETAHKVIERLGEDRVVISTSCSLLHVPYSLDIERVKRDADSDFKDKVLEWLSFGLEKVAEVVVISQTLEGQDTSVVLNANKVALQNRAESPLVVNSDVRKRLEESKDVKKLFRVSPFSKRIADQQKRLNLPDLPTTTIGSFPQTAQVRSMRACHKAKKISPEEYIQFIKDETKKCIEIQEEIGLDVLAHGEFERNDMVEYFAENLEGFLVSRNGWVQSYGTRCVKPAIIFGDVQRKYPMTIKEITYAQSLTKKPVKGMLTGPTTMLKWSFVRNDEDFSTTCMQVALALRDEVNDLESSGIAVIQVDEPGFREGLPIEEADRPKYLKTAIDCFKVSTGGVQDYTQIHTHMCYSDFDEILGDVAKLDADVISIECARSDLKLLYSFSEDKYPQNIGPGVYDIHSPRVPSQEELLDKMSQISKIIPKNRLWINPDCGLKTRGWKETKEALINLVEATKQLRSQV